MNDFNIITAATGSREQTRKTGVVAFNINGFDLQEWEKNAPKPSTVQSQEYRKQNHQAQPVNYAIDAIKKEDGTELKGKDIYNASSPYSIFANYASDSNDNNVGEKQVVKFFADGETSSDPLNGDLDDYMEDYVAAAGKDGIMTYHEFVQWHNGEIEGLAGLCPNAGELTDEELEERYALATQLFANASGMQYPENFGVGAAQADRDYVNSTTVNQRVRDGYYRTKEEAQKAAFDVSDIDGNGVLEGEELNEFYRQTGGDYDRDNKSHWEYTGSRFLNTGNDDANVLEGTWGPNYALKHGNIKPEELAELKSTEHWDQYFQD